jgi:hypothetical protein
MKQLITIAAALSVLAIGNLSHASRAGVRNQNQAGRIEQGVKSGELTRPEARKLRREEKRIHGAEAKAKSDGTVTPEEKAKIEAMQDKASKNIYDQKHDDQVRPNSPADEKKQ